MKQTVQAVQEGHASGRRGCNGYLSGASKSNGQLGRSSSRSLFGTRIFPSPSRLDLRLRNARV